MRKIIMLFVILLSLLCVSGCSGIAPMPEKMPPDFDFSIAWGVNKLNSYNSRTNLLIKDLGDQGSAQVDLAINNDKMNEIYDDFLVIDIISYPHEVYLYGEGHFVSPSIELEITVMYKWGSFTVMLPCANIIPDEEIVNGEELLVVGNRIIEYIKSTDEYQSLPNYDPIYL